MSKITQEIFINNAIKIHGDKYDYSKATYKNYKEKMIILCKIHGEEFEMSYVHHIQSKRGCKKCTYDKLRNKYSKTLEQFIEDSKKIHGDYYDYSKVNYVNSITDVEIICPHHGSFFQEPNSHCINGRGCKKCATIRTKQATSKTKEEFIIEAKEIHGNKYDYSNVVYENSKIHVEIICKEHGIFSQSPSHHIDGEGCPMCKNNTISKLKTKPKEKFIKECITMFGDIYDYNETNYTDAKTKVIIKCNIHGYFDVKPVNLFNRKYGCPTCNNETNIDKNLTTIKFIEQANILHNNTYDYSETIYCKYYMNLEIICKTHGKFTQKASNHLRGNGCYQCSLYNRAITTRRTQEEFIKIANRKHNNIYDYSKLVYVNSFVPIIVICNKKNHGEFEVKPFHHIGKNGTACPKCSVRGYSKMAINYLNFISKYYNLNIQHKLNGGEFLIPNTKFRADGYCAENNTVYEFMGTIYHGDPRVCEPDDKSYFGVKYGKLYGDTIKRINIIKNLGYNIVEMWEFDWLKINKNISILQKIFRIYKK